LLYTNNQYQLSVDDNRQLFDAVSELYERPADDRRLGNLRLSRELRAGLQNWIGTGEDSWLFDNVQDTIRFNHFQVFDFMGADDEDGITALQPLMFYLFRRQTMIVQDPAIRTTFKMLWCDEAFRFLNNDICRRKFIAGGKGYRKHNAGIGLVTQSTADLTNAGMLEIATEMCPTKIWLYNPGADVDRYASIYHWNAAEADAFRSLVGKRDFLIKQGDGLAHLLRNHLDPESLIRYGNSPLDNQRREDAIKEHGYQRGLEVLAAKA